jgi:hypothetical protein
VEHLFLFIDAVIMFHVEHSSTSNRSFKIYLAKVERAIQIQWLQGPLHGFSPSFRVVGVSEESEDGRPRSANAASKGIFLHGGFLDLIETGNP